MIKMHGCGGTMVRSAIKTCFNNGNDMLWIWPGSKLGYQFVTMKITVLCISLYVSYCFHQFHHNTTVFSSPRCFALLSEGTEG